MKEVSKTTTQENQAAQWAMTWEELSAQIEWQNRQKLINKRPKIKSRYV